MPPNRQVPEKDPRREAGTEICALIDGRAPKNDAQKDALMHIVWELLWEDLWYFVLTKPFPKGYKKVASWKKFVDATVYAVRQSKKWMKDDFFKVNGFSRAIERRISDMEKLGVGQEGSHISEVNMLNSLKQSEWLD